MSTMTRAPIGLGEALVAIDWSSQPAREIHGTHGRALERTTSLGSIRVRLVEFSPGYEADHWCTRGHIAFVVEGTCTLRIDDGRAVTLSRGQSFTVGDEIDAHMLVTEHGAIVFLVD